MRTNNTQNKEGTTREADASRLFLCPEAAEMGEGVHMGKTHMNPAASWIAGLDTVVLRRMLPGGFICDERRDALTIRPKSRRLTMGLDVSLYRFDDYEKTTALEGEYNEKSEEIWNRTGKKYEEMTEEEKDDARNEVARLSEKMGLDCGDDSKRKQRIEKDSRIHPDHLFKMGYFRSSYNSGGINTAMDSKLGLYGLYHIFDVKDKHEYHIQPDWEASLGRAKDMVKKWKAQYKSCGHDVHKIHLNPDFGHASANEALKAFTKKLKEHSKEKVGFGDFGCRDGDFWLENPMTVKAIMPSKEQGILGGSNVYVITESNPEGYEWYLHALEIVVETIEYVLTQNDPSKFYLGWSA